MALGMANAVMQLRRVELLAGAAAASLFAFGCGGGSHGGSRSEVCTIDSNTDTHGGALQEALSPPAAPVNPRTIATFTFDDGRADAFAAKDILAPFGIKATFFIITGRVGEATYLSWEQLAQLQAVGHEIGGHTVHHVDLASVDAATATSEVCGSRQALLGRGFPGLSFSYPFDGFSTQVEDIVRQCGYTAARVSRGLESGGLYAETLPPADPLHIRTPVSVTNTTTVDQLEQYIIDAENDGGGWVPLVFHHICDGGTSLAIKPADLRSLAAWLSQRSSQGTAVRTMHQVIGGP